MKKALPALYLLFAVLALITGRYSACNEFEEDIIPTSAGDLKITFIGHASLMFTFDGMVIHIDPWSEVADYAKLPRADVVFITHHHPDHLDLKALAPLCTDKTIVVYTEKCAETLKGGIVMGYGDKRIVNDLPVEAVPAYNLTNLMKKNGKLVHPKGIGNGYIITFGDKRVYIASETENIPELKRIENIDIAFIAMDSVYNMTPEMAAEAVRVFRPKVLYPYHFADADVTEIVRLLADMPEIEVRIRDMK